MFCGALRGSSRSCSLLLYRPACLNMSTNITPCCPIKPYRHEAHGDIREDPYFWLRDKKNPEVLKYLQQENDYADQVYRDTSMDQLKDSCYKEFLARIKETDETAPFKDSSYLYYERTVEGQDYNIYCRKKILQGSMEDISSLETAEEQILLDVNQIAADLDYCDIGHFFLFFCHSKIAYTLDTEGDEQYSLQILDLATSPPSYIHRNLLCDITCKYRYKLYNIQLTRSYSADRMEPRWKFYFLCSYGRCTSPIPTLPTPYWIFC